MSAVRTEADSAIATAADYAAIEFEPLGPVSGEPPTNEEWAELANPYLVTIRLAWLTVQKTKGELVDAIRDVSAEASVEMIDNFEQTIAFFEANLELLRAAEIRLLAAGSVVVQEGAS